MEQLSRNDALEKIREHLNEGSIMLTKHFRQRLQERNVSMQDIIAVIKNGVIQKAPEKDLVTSEWKYRIEGTSIDEIDTSVIVSIVNDKLSKYITVF